MKAIRFSLILFFSVCILCCVDAHTKANENTSEETNSKRVDVYYFHNTRRCATCNAVEDVAKSTVNKYYKGIVNFYAYNLDQADAKKVAEKLKVSGQALIIVAGNKKIDITADGFLNARSKPEKLTKLIRDKIDSLL